MYNVLIIDDETPVRQVIKALGQWKKAGVDQVLEAVEGGGALEIMRRSKTEIVFLDMNMPNMNGVDFLKTACKEFPKTKYIVISGYEDFEYTKQAIRSKVLDYLLKPIVESELNQVLFRAVHELEDECKRERDRLRLWADQNMAMPLARENVISQMMEADESLQVTAEQKRILEISDADLYYGIVLFSILNMGRVCTDEFGGDTQLAFFAFTNVIDELASHWCGGFSFKPVRAGDDIVFFFSAGSADIKSFEASLPRRVILMVKKLEELFGAYCVACIGETVPKIEDINESYKTAQDILNSINILQCEDRVFTKKNIEKKAERASLIDKKEILIYAFESGRADYAKSIMGRYFEDIRRRGFWSKDDLYRSATEFLVIIGDIVDKLGIENGRSIISEYRWKNPANTFTKLEEFKEFVLNVVEQLFASIKSNMKISEKADLYEIKDYIEKNFSRETPLSYFSDKYFLSKEYLSKRFREEFGFGIHEYILRVRMEKAAEMLRGPSAKIQSVACYLGYKDNNYFSRAFKAYYGVSPSEYRNRQ